MASEESGRGGSPRVRRAIATSVHGNAPAFGFSIMITVSLGVASTMRLPPGPAEMALFGVSAAIGVSVLEGAVSRGFRDRLDEAPQEVQLLGTAMNFLSVLAGVGTAAASAWLVPGVPGWAFAGFLAAVAYVLTESAEILAAQRLQASAGDPDAEPSD